MWRKWASIIMSFNAKAAASVLRIPDEKMRDKVAQTIDAYVSSLEKELGRSVPPPVVRKELVAAFERALGATLVPGELRADEREAYKTWVGKMRSREWMNDVQLDRAGNKPLLITGHVHLGYGMHKAPGGLVRVTLVVASDEVKEALVSGDFYAIGDAPVDIERALLGSADADAIGTRLEAVWPSLETPGVEASDVAKAAQEALAQARAPVAAGARG
jgi:lipoate-protein ligase A